MSYWRHTFSYWRHTNFRHSYVITVTDPATRENTGRNQPKLVVFSYRGTVDPPSAPTALDGRETAGVRQRLTLDSKETHRSDIHRPPNVHRAHLALAPAFLRARP